jgi:hypothetical protein
MKQTYVVKWEATVEAESFLDAARIAALTPRTSIDVRLATSNLFHHVTLSTEEIK